MCVPEQRTNMLGICSQASVTLALRGSRPVAAAVGSSFLPGQQRGAAPIATRKHAAPLGGFGWPSTFGQSGDGRIDSRHVTERNINTDAYFAECSRTLSVDVHHTLSSVATLPIPGVY